MFGNKIWPVEVALSSPAQRCVDTTQLFLEAAKRPQCITTTEALYKQRGFQAKLGYASLDAYLADGTQTYKLSDHAEAAVQMLLQPMKLCTSGKSLLMCGHGIYTSAIAQYVVYLLGRSPYAPPPPDDVYFSSMRLVSEENVPEASGFVIKPDASAELLRL